MQPILVVDDEELVLALIQRCLSSAGYTVDTTSSALEALAMIEGGYRPSLVIMDLRMPVMDGNELVQKLQEGPLASVPKIMLSAYLGDLKEELRGSFRLILEKPVPCKKLVELVKESLSPTLTV